MSLLNELLRFYSLLKFFPASKKLWDKYAVILLELILEGMLDGKQGEKLKQIIPLTGLNLVTQLCFMLNSILAPFESAKEPLENNILECVFITCLTWSFGASLIEESRLVFDSKLKYLSQMLQVIIIVIIRFEPHCSLKFVEDK